jgi:hypothetical protein
MGHAASPQAARKSLKEMDFRFIHVAMQRE